MEITSFRKYPTPESSPLAGVSAGSRKRVRLRTDLTRFALVLVILGAARWAVADIEQTREAERVQAAERDRLERRSRDPAWVYARLAERYDFDKLSEWCGLIPAPVSADEVTRLEAAARAADPREAPCDGFAKDWAAERGRVVLVGSLKWYKLRDPTDPDRWIGIAVKQFEYPDGSHRAIWCRVRTGF